MRFVDLMAERKFVLVVSLPSNDLKLARAALDGGADAVKVHCNVWHRASGHTFGTYEENRGFLRELIGLCADVPVGLVPGTSEAFITERELKELEEMGLDFISAYSQNLPSFAMDSRKINGVYKLTVDDLTNNVMFPDAVAMGGYPIDVHSPDGNNTVHKFLKPGSWYSIPYRSLVTNEIDNLIVAGRCISATQEACSSTRLTPIVMALGQAAGTAAAQCVATGEKANALNTGVLRAQLKKNGAFLEEYQG